MPKDHAALPRTHVRRSDRAVEDDDWIRATLRGAAYGHLATVHEDQPFINSNLFVYDENANIIYMHTARYGRTRANVEREEKVCFTVSEMGRLLPADVALEFSVEYRSVVVFGRASIVEEEAEATRALQQLLDKYFPHLEPGRDYRPPVPEELKRTSVYRIAIDDWSGKKKEVEAFPGAFTYGDFPEAG
ncbi:MAG: pyridoxamine 5'-phosphate oxidase family protein [Candidatus Promineifilaceae bacterium]|nr:pyridoxamine 5'-phosphate oxidase family protein [Candidatus Promineifilaceae bacterium]